MKELLTALSKAKSEIGAISKDSKNPFFKSKYFDINSLIEHVNPVLEKHGLLLLQPISGGFVISKVYHIESGYFIESALMLNEYKDPQKAGSEITYFRRYTLQCLLGLQAEDDDANKASGKVIAPKPKQKAEKKPFIKEALTQNHEAWSQCLSALVSNQYTMVDVEKKYTLTPEVKTLLNDEAAKHMTA